MATTDRSPLKSTDWLAAHLGDADLRIYDCTSFLLPDPVMTFRVESGRANWSLGHIPGANYIALQDDISDQDSGLRFTMPARDRLATRLASLGVDDRCTVVLYSTTHYMWATRVWWMLKEIGFTLAYVLDGGFEKWKGENRPVAQQSELYPPGRLTTSGAARLFADKSQVAAAIADPRCVLVNALPPAQYRGDPGQPHHGRPGHIKSSVNVPALSLLGPAGTLRHPTEIESLLRGSGVTRDMKVICYCGGGVSATCVALALTLCGYEQVAVYDGSLNEWARDPALPMEAS